MRQTTNERPRTHLPWALPNTGGERYPVKDGLAVFTLIVGVAACLIGFNVALHVISFWIGAVGLAVGLYAQLTSMTRSQRILIVTGLIGSFMGVALGLGHGGFLP